MDHRRVTAGPDRVREAPLRSDLLILGDQGLEGSPLPHASVQAGVEAWIRSRLPPGSIVGLIGRTGWDLVDAWESVLIAGCRPVILQYPTTKLARSLWHEELRRSIAAMEIAALVWCDLDTDTGLALPQLGLTGTPRTERTAALGRSQGTLIQLSSGTTGHRKALAPSMAEIGRHVAEYNQSLGLGPDDCVISWLPLYHDMGLIAGYLMPRLLGCRLVLLDRCAGSAGRRCWPSWPRRSGRPTASCRISGSR